VTHWILTRSTTLDSFQIHRVCCVGVFIELSLLFSLFASALLGQDVKVSELLSRVQLLCMHHIYYDIEYPRFNKFRFASICEPGLDCRNKMLRLIHSRRRKTPIQCFLNIRLTLDSYQIHRDCCVGGIAFILLFLRLVHVRR
jgi:hypothetical protein